MASKEHVTGLTDASKVDEKGKEGKTISVGLVYG
jgi:hypothetical protein